MFSRADVRMSDNVLTDNFLIATNPNPGQQQWVDKILQGWKAHLKVVTNQILNRWALR